MTTSVKKSLLNYLEFLKENGFLYAEGVEPAAVVLADAPVVAAPTAGPGARVVALNTAPSLAPAAKHQAPRAQPAVTPGVVAAPPLEPGKVLTREERVAWLNETAARAEACRACPLGARRNKLVFSDGDPMARVVFVGEAPGASEDETGTPFIGEAGQLLNKMIAAIGFRRDEVYICNTIKCRPPHNRDPLPEEKAACEHFLIEQLQILRPQIVFALGLHAAQYLCHSAEPMNRLRGRWFSYHGIPLLATYHPAFLLRHESFKSKCWEDFKLLHVKYTELTPDDPRALWSKKEKTQ